MISVDRNRCTYCGGCVSVCPAGALTLAEARLVVSDAARQVDPLTGGGIINAMVAGKLAAEVTVRAIAADDTSAAFLGHYERAWQRDMDRRMARNYRLRERFPPGRRTDRRFVRAFALAVGG